MKKIEISVEEALLLDSELYKLQMQIMRQNWSVDDAPSSSDLHRARIINELREKIGKCFKKISIEKFIDKTKE